MLSSRQSALAFVAPPATSRLAAAASARHRTPRGSGPATQDAAPADTAALELYLTTLTVPALKDLLRQQSLRVGGNKADLVARLTGTEAAGGASLLSTDRRATLERARRERLALMADRTRALKKQKREAPDGRPATPGLTTRVTAAVERAEARASERNSDPATPRVDSGFHDIQELPRSLVLRLDAMGIVEPTPIQWEAIPAALQGQDVLGVAQTGTGKTLAFGLPLVSRMMDDMASIAHKHSKRPLRGLILAPTRELANQIAVEVGTLMQQTPLNAFVVVGGQSISTQMNKLRAMRTDLLVATPGRLLDLMDRGALSLSDTSFLVLDEADLMLDMGFLRDLKKIAQRLPPKRQTMLFSATMSKDMNEVASSYLKNPKKIEIARAGKTADNIAQEVHFVERSDRTDILIGMLSESEHREDRAIVFGRTKHGMERLCQKILGRGIPCASIHGNKSQPQRERALAGFKAGDIKVLVATDVAARGLDIPDVKRVYNFELPNQAEAYVHRIGRTARAGKDGVAVSFCAKEDMEYLYDIQKLIKLDIPVASGVPYTRQQTQGAKDRVKANKQLQGQRRSNGQEGKRKNPNKKKRSNNNGEGREGGGSKGGGSKKKYKRKWLD